MYKMVIQKRQHRLLIDFEIYLLIHLKCKIHNAFFIAKYLTHTNALKQIPVEFRDLKSFTKISPNAISDRDDLLPEIYVNLIINKKD